MTLAADMTAEQGRGALAALLLFAFVMVGVLTAVALLLLSLHRRRRGRDSSTSLHGAPPLDAWRESGRRAAPPVQDDE